MFNFDDYTSYIADSKSDSNSYELTYIGNYSNTVISQFTPNAILLDSPIKK